MNTDIDIELASLELIRLLRGSRGQLKLSKLLGYNFNQLSKWETGRTSILWTDFVAFCAAVKAPLSNALHDASKYDEPDLADYARLLPWIIGTNTQSEIALTLAVSRPTVSRWLRGDSPPTLLHILKALHCYRGSMEIFTLTLTGEKNLPALDALRQRRVAVNEVHRQFPFSGTLVRCLELAEYQNLAAHSDAFVAKKLGLGIRTVKRCYQALLEAQLVEKCGPKLQVSPSARRIRSDARGQEKYLMHEFWLDIARLRFAAGFNPRTSGSIYRNMALSDKAHSELKEILAKMFQTIGTLVENDRGPAKNLVVFCAQYFPPDFSFCAQAKGWLE